MPPPTPSRPRRMLRRLTLLAALLLAVAALAAVDRAGSGPRAAPGAESPADLLEPPTPLTRAWMRLRGPPTIGLQIGHLDARSQPAELSGLRTSTGGHAGGVNEIEVNRAVVEALAARLEADGLRVEILPATVPPRYRADALISVHADVSPDPTRRGYKSAHPVPARSALETVLKAHVDAAYLRASPLPDDDANVSGAMLGYYAFAERRYLHAAHRATPGLIVELGYLSHPGDRAWLLEPGGPADALARGLRRYLAHVDRWHPVLASTTQRPGRSDVLAWAACAWARSSCS